MAETRQPRGAENAAPLTKPEQDDVRASDTADTSPRVPDADTSGRRVRAVLWGGATDVELSRADFAAVGIEHDAVKFSYDKDECTLPVNPKKGQKGLTEEAAEYLTREHPTLFEYFGEEETG